MQRNTLLKKTQNMFLIGMATMAFLVGCDQKPDAKAVQNFEYTQQDEEHYTLFANQILRFHAEDLIAAVKRNFNKPISKRASIQTSMKAWLEFYPEEEDTIPMPADPVRKQAFINRFVQDYSVGSASSDNAKRLDVLEKWERALLEAHYDVLKHNDIFYAPNFYYDGPILPRTLQKETSARWVKERLQASYQND